MPLLDPDFSSGFLLNELNFSQEDYFKGRLLLAFMQLLLSEGESFSPLKVSAGVQLCSNKSLFYFNLPKSFLTAFLLGFSFCHVMKYFCSRFLESKMHPT